MTIISFDKAIALAVIKPFYFAFRHFLNPSLNLYYPTAFLVRYLELLRNRTIIPAKDRFPA
jgi:hypothetical protein